MKKLLLSALAIALTLTAVPQFVFAGGIDNKQNFSARYMATGSRNAALDGADIAAYNPAGIMMQDHNGYMVEADVQYIWKDYEQRVDNSDFNATGGDITESFTGGQDEPSVVPTFFTTFKNDKWGAFGSFTVNGGGGEVDYKSGNAVTNGVAIGAYTGTYGENILLGPAVDPGDYAIAGGPNATSVTSNASVFADSYYYTFTAGGTYAFTDRFSMALGARYVMAEKSIEADADVSDPITGKDHTVRADYEQDADGIGYVVGFDYKATEKINMAVRYESEVELEFETDLGAGNTELGNAILDSLDKAKKLAPDNYTGVSEDRNLPAVLGVGVSTKLSEWLTLDTSFTYYFEEQADWDGQEDLVTNSYDIGISGTFDVTDSFRFSLGYMHTDVGIEAKDYDVIAKLSPPLDAETLAVGCGYDFNDKMTLQLGFMSINYSSDIAESEVIDKETGLKGGTYEYDKQNYNLTAGLVYKF